MNTVGTGHSSLGQSIITGPNTVNRTLSQASEDAQRLLIRQEKGLDSTIRYGMLRHFRQDLRAAQTFLLFDDIEDRHAWLMDEWMHVSSTSQQ